MRPAFGRLVLLAQPEFRAFAQVERKGPHAVRAVGTDRRDDPLVDGSREDKSPVVVGMLADEVDAPGRGEEHGSFTEELREFAAYSLFHVRVHIG